MPSHDAAPMMKDLSGSLTRFTAWMTNFLAQGTLVGGAAFPAGAAGPPATGLVLLGALNTAWQAAFALATSPFTRTAQTVAAMKILRNGAPILPASLIALGAVPGIGKGVVGAIRTYIATIVAGAALTPDARVRLGLTAHDKVRSVPTVPQMGPVLWLDRSPPHVLVVRYHIEGSRAFEKAKPPGCKVCNITWSLANGVSGSVAATKNPVYIDVGIGNSGQQCRLQGQWVMGNNKRSPASNPIVTGVP
jgi:hypothetical protein